VANATAKHGVDVLSFPQGSRVAKITNIGDPQGVCADTSGHVWITAFLQGRKFALYEFARGATTPLHTVERNESYGTCTVDSHGDPVVFGKHTAYSATIETWSPSLRRRLRVVQIPVAPVSTTYDDDGNLYVKGFEGSDPAFAVLRKGTSTLTFLTVKKGDDFQDGCLGWDGAYVTLGAFDRKQLIYRLSIDGKIATIVSRVHLHDVAPNPKYLLTGHTIVAALNDGRNAKRIGFYDYPSGGKPEAVFSGFYNPMQIALSPG
jgi:hypothetical protein